MFGFARRRRFLEYDYVPLLVNRHVTDVQDEDEYEGEDAEVLDSRGSGVQTGPGAAESEALDAADDRERIHLPTL